MIVMFLFSSRRRHTRCALVTGVQTCALPIFAGSSPAPARRRPFAPRDHVEGAFPPGSPTSASRAQSRVGPGILVRADVDEFAGQTAGGGVREIGRANV